MLAIANDLPPICKTFEEIGEKFDQIEIGAEDHFGVDAARSEQEAADIKRGPRTLATGHTFKPPRSDNGLNGLQDSLSSGKGAQGGTGSKAGSSKQTGLNGATFGRGQGQESDELADGDAISGFGVDGLHQAGNREGVEGTSGSAGSAGAVRESDDVSMAGRSGGGSERKIVASAEQAHYTPVSIYKYL